MVLIPVVFFDLAIIMIFFVMQEAKSQIMAFYQKKTRVYPLAFVSATI